MRYAFVLDIPATWDAYLGIAAALKAPAPAGLLIHVAGPTEEGFRMIGIWESRERWERFRDARLGAVLDELVGDSWIKPTYRELSIGHLLSGPSEHRVR